MLLRSRNHRESSGQSLEPVGSEIFPAQRAWDYQKDFNGFLPVRAQKRFVLFDWFVFVHFSRIAEFSDYGEIRIQEIMCFITWITINAHALGTSLSGKASHSAERWRFLALHRCSGTSWRSCKELSGIIILENIINEKFLNNFWPFLLNNNPL